MTREEAIKILKSKIDGHTDTSYEWAETIRMAIEDMKEMDRLSKATPVLKEPERPRGEWEKYGGKVEAYDISGIKTWGQKRKCTNCDFIKIYIEDFGLYSICPNCGAIMTPKASGEEDK